MREQPNSKTSDGLRNWTVQGDAVRMSHPPESSDTLELFAQHDILGDQPGQKLSTRSYHHYRAVEAMNTVLPSRLVNSTETTCVHLITSLSHFKASVTGKPYGLYGGHSTHYASSTLPLTVHRAVVYDRVWCMVTPYNATSSGWNPKLRREIRSGAILIILETGHTLNSSGSGIGTGEMNSHRSHPPYPVLSRDIPLAS